MLHLLKKYSKSLTGTMMSTPELKPLKKKKKSDILELLVPTFLAFELTNIEISSLDRALHFHQVCHSPEHSYPCNSENYLNIDKSTVLSVVFSRDQF